MPSSNNELISFTGPAGRTYFDHDGALQTAGENEIREEYDPLTGAYRGMLIESQERTNLISNSENFSSWGFVQDGDASISTPVIVSKTESAPDGTNTAWRFRFEVAEDYSLINLRDSFSEAQNFSFYARLVNGNTRKFQTYKDNITDGEEFVFTSNIWERFERKIGAIGNSLKIGLITSFGAKIGDVIEMDIWGVQLEPTEKATSYIPTNGSPVTLQAEDARFTDPVLFNNFERGAFYVDFKSISAQHDSWILFRSSVARFLYYHTDNLRVYDGSHAVSQLMSEDSLYTSHKYQVSWDQNGVKTNVDGSKTESMSFDGSWNGIDLVIGYRWSGYIKSLDFNPEPYSDVQGRQITKRDARTIIGECPNGGYYDYSDLSTMLIESDESGILAEDRKIARVGDPIGAILDKSGHGNHLTASTDSRRGVLRFDGENYYIERDINTIYGFDYVGDRSLTAIIALQNYSDNFIVLCNGDGGGGDYAMIYGSGTGSYLRWNLFSDPKHYFNGSYRPTSNRGDAHAGLTTDPIILRTLHQVQNDESTRVYVGGYTSSSWGLTGNEYGFAWGSRLSEDDAALVEQDMRHNMPSVSG